MSLKKYITISSASLVLLLTFGYLLSINKKDNNLKIKEGNINLKKFNTPHNTTELKEDESYQDSVLYHKIAMDYGNFWQATNPLLKNKKVAFNRYSGKILIYINKKANCFKNNLPADHVFSWDFDTIQPYKIKGIYGWTDKDTVMYWVYNGVKDILIDEHGNIFKRIK